MKRPLQISAIAALLIAGCATDSDAPHLYTGMSRDRLKGRFGEPIRVEHTAGGGEDWYYTFSNVPEVQGSTYHDAQTQSDSASIGICYTTGTTERPVHLSPDGYVIAPLPRGHIVR
jgi:hypothetical protein